MTPEPMAPAECDLRGYDYMPLFGHRLFSSNLYAESTDAEFRAALRLWWAAWQQCPAGSLPKADAALAMLADYGRDLKGWLKVKARALHGFVECSDGRLYHPFLCDEAVKAYALRLKHETRREKDRERLSAWREARKKQEPNGGGGDSVTPSEAPNETRFTTQSETTVETSNVVVDKTRQDKTRQKEERTPLPPKGGVSDDDPDFAEFWRAYPRKDDKGHARRAWLKARKIAAPAQIIAGCHAYRFNENPRFVPLPATWLNGERWLQAQDDDGFDPVLRAVGLTPDDFDIPEQPAMELLQ